ncbi:hypothetical protein GCK32_019900 [Trichostrongylus colubriformis]|uniref:Uncharacterized protein n=1 Tax=Trichostrongylus colubriformis TaxID=6319 RepID=A0AAN8F6S1_TRICO
MKILGKDLTQIVTPPVQERPSPPTAAIDYEAHELSGLQHRHWKERTVFDDEGTLFEIEEIEGEPCSKRASTSTSCGD